MQCFFLTFIRYDLIACCQRYASYIDRIFRSQKKAMRAISFQPSMSPSLPIFNDFKLLKLSEQFELRILTFVLILLKKTPSTCFHDFFLLNSSFHQYSTKQASQGDLYMSRKNNLQYGLKFIRYLGANHWNALPVEFRNALSETLFRQN